MRILERVVSWQSASPACKAAFIEAMTGLLYGDEETLNAWVWFYAGWEADVG